MLIDYGQMHHLLRDAGMANWSDQLVGRLSDYFSDIRHGDFPAWRDAVLSLPDINSPQYEFNEPVVRVGTVDDLDAGQRALIHACLVTLMPWRKGPFDFFGIHVDCEWRSDWKWSRLADSITPLADRMVLDIGCGNGYHGWRMLGEGARLVVGTDPTLRYVLQFQAAKHFLPDCPHFVLPFALEGLAGQALVFDSVFSMGVIYHRRDPSQHLFDLTRCMRSGGQLILESLVVDEGNIDVLVPQGRYARMNNVWHVPSCRTLEHWMLEAGLRNVRIIDVCRTTVDEQRPTDWMVFESLADCLNPEDSSHTVEGYPAPVRAVVVAEKP